MDNKTFELIGDSEQDLMAIIGIAWRDFNSYHRAKYYNTCEIDGRQTLILFWEEEPNAIKLPYPLDTADKGYEFIKGWLSTCDRPAQPDHDGDNSPGFRVFTDSWGHVNGTCYGFVGVQFAWAMYGK